MQQLQSSNIPFIFLTNGGGKSELARIQDLRDRLRIPSLREDAIVQSHTPFRDLKHLHDKNVLVIGGDGGKCREVAQSYGFKSVILPGDIWASRNDVWPFANNFSSYYSKFVKPLPTTDNLKIDAIFAFNDPRDFGLDLALTVDLLLSSKGVLGTLSPKNNDDALPNRGYQQDGQPELYFSNPDLWWANSYPLSRLGQGAFREALEGVWAAITGGPAAGVTLQREVMGKPYQKTYEFAERLLVQNRERLSAESRHKLPPLRKVFMIGDNPESDIAGANNFKSPLGIEWVSVLVETGVWRGGKPAHTPKMIMKDVFSAVQWAINSSEHDGNPS